MKSQNMSLGKRLILNNLITVALGAVVLMAAFGIVATIDALTGYGMGFEIILIPFVAASLVFLGSKLLIPVHRFLWASVMGPVILAVIFSGLTFFEGSGLHWNFYWDFFVLALGYAIVLSALVYVGLWLKVRKERS